MDFGHLGSSSFGYGQSPFFKRDEKNKTLNIKATQAVFSNSVSSAYSCMQMNSVEEKKTVSPKTVPQIALSEEKLRGFKTLPSVTHNY